MSSPSHSTLEPIVKMVRDIEVLDKPDDNYWMALPGGNQPDGTGNFLQSNPQLEMACCPAGPTPDHKQ